MPVFAQGIVWDHREPPPPEYGGGLHVPSRKRTADGVQKPSVSLLAKLPRQHLPSLAIQEDDRTVLPPWSVVIEASIVHDTATFHVTQMFWNNSEFSIPHGAFTFPLPDGCAVTGFNCRIGTARTLKGIVKLKDDARAEFEHQKIAGRTVGLMEENTSEIFTTELGNIPAQTKVKIELMFVMLLKHHLTEDDSTTTLTIPTSIAARYGSPDFQVSSSSDIPQGLTLKIEVHGADASTLVTSRTHDILVRPTTAPQKADTWAAMINQDNSNNEGDNEHANNILLVTAQIPTSFLKKDFVLDIKASIPTEPQAWLETHPSIENQKALMMHVPRHFLLEPRMLNTPSEVLFLIDRSGSMEDKMDSVIFAMQFLLKGIPQGRKFNIWSFGSSYTSLWPKSAIYSEYSLNAALSYISTLAADMGGTEIHSALQAMMAVRDYTHTTDAIILTDGQVWRLDETLGFIQRQREELGSTTRFFSLGIGDAASHALVEGIARYGGGFSEMIPSSALKGAWEDRLVSMTKAALLTSTVSILDICLIGERDEERRIGLSHVSPFKTIRGVHGAFTGDRHLLLLDQSTMAKDPNRITIETRRVDGSEAKVTIQISHVAAGMTGIHSLAARSMIEHIEAKMLGLGEQSVFDTGDVKEQHRTLREQAEHMSQKWSLCSRWTSFFLVEESNRPLRTRGIYIGQPSLLTNLGGTSLPYPALSARTGGPSCRYRRRARSTATCSTSSYAPMRDDYPSESPSVTTSYSLPRRLGALEYYNKSEQTPFSQGLNPPPSTPSKRPMLYSPALGNIVAIKPATRLLVTQSLQRMLDHQCFDGSFHFPDSHSLRKVLGREVADRLHTLAAWGASERLIYTTAIVVLLERDYAEQKGLWELMHIKAMEFIQSCTETFAKAEMEERLHGLSICLEENDSAMDDKDLADNIDDTDCDGASDSAESQRRPSLALMAPRDAISRVPDDVD